MNVLRAEWTKFRTVRGWVIGMIVAGLLVVGVGLLGHSECGGVIVNGTTVSNSGCTSPLGPGGEAVTDSFYFVHRSLGPSGSLTVQVTSMTGTAEPWSKAGIIVKASLTQGSAYAAMMVTGGHGVRMQWDYTQDVPGLAGTVSAAAPRWLRLTRSGDTLTGYDSADGTHWTRVATATLTGFPATAQAGLFAANPGTTTLTSQSVASGSSRGGITQSTATFGHVAVTGGKANAWTGTDLNGPNPTPGDGYHQSGAQYTVTGTGDIAPAPTDGSTGVTSATRALVGTFAGLIVVIVVGTSFITAEYRRGLIDVTLTAVPHRGRVLAAKAAVLGGLTFVAGLPVAYVALLLGEWRLRSGGNFIAPVPALTEVRVLAGTAALLALAAVLALAIGALTRRAAIAVTAVIAVIVLPYFFASPLAILPASAGDWLLRVTPAAAFAVQQAYPSYPQVLVAYTPQNGYYPLTPWLGLAVLAAWTAAALALAGRNS
jgi:ABC-type transport system involved in multi-copper enzyme maturation permease subunit